MSPFVPVRFGQRQGLEISGAAQTQRGLTVLENADLDLADVVRRSRGTVAFTPTRSSDPEDVIPGDSTRAVWARADEILLEAEQRLYALNRCAGQSGAAIPVGTATPGEIATATAEITARASTELVESIGLPGDPEAATVQARVDRPNLQVPLVQVASPRTLTVTLTEPTPGRISWTMTEGAAVNGPHPLPGANASSLQRLGRMQVVTGQDVLITYLDNGGLRAYQLRLLVSPAAVSPLDFGVLGLVRGAATAARYEARDGVIAGFLRTDTNALVVWDAFSPTSFRAYTPTTPVPVETTGGYSFDFRATGGFSVDMGVAWTAPSTASATISWALLDGASTSLTEVVAAPLSNTADRVAVESSPTGDPDRYVVGIRLPGQKPVVEVGPVDPVQRLVANTLTTDLVITRTGSAVTSRWRAASGNITVDADLVGVATPTDAVIHRDAAGIYLAIVDVAGFQEARTVRALAPPTPAIRDGAVLALGLKGSPTRLVYSYRQDATTWRIGVYTSTQDPSPTITDFAILTDLAPAGAQGLGILSEAGADDVVLRAYAVSDIAALEIFGATLTTLTSVVADVETQTVDSLPDFLTSTPLGTPPRALVGVWDGTVLIYEDSPTIFVLVSPVGVALISGSWTDRGAWSRMRHRRQRVRATQNTLIAQSNAVTVTSAQGVDCTLVGTEIVDAVTGGVVIDVLSSFVEFRQTLVSGEDAHNPRTADYGLGKGALGYVDVPAGNAVRVAIWTPGDPLVFATTSTVSDGPLGLWDMAGSTTTTGLAGLLLVGCTSMTDIIFESRSDAGDSSITHGQGADIIDVCAHLRPATATTIRGVIAVALANTSVRIYQVTLTPSTGAIVEDWTIAIGFAGIPIAATAAVEADLTSHTLWVETPFATSSQVRLFDVTSGGVTALDITSGGVTKTTIERAAIMSQQAIVQGQSAGLLEFLAADLDQSRKVGGVVLFSGRSQEVIGRSALGITALVSPATRTDRYTHGSLVLDDAGGLSAGIEVRDIFQRNSKQVQAQLLRWPVDRDPHRPAVVDAVAYAAHGGYPRQYDGERVYEGDWHTLPTFTVTVVGGGSLSAGSYTVAGTWEYENIQGQLERSAPTFVGPMAVLANQAINVTYDDLPLTERDRPRFVAWRTTADGEGTLLYRDGTALAQGGAGLISLMQSDDDLQLNPRLLDQVPGGILAADQLDATDLMGMANGRAWTVDPATLTYMRFSIQQRAGFALHWSGAALIEHPREEPVTSIHELSGRVVMFTAQGVAYVHGDGPSNTGAGSYTVPMSEPVEIGALCHPATAITPDGIAFASGKGLRMLTRGLQVLDLAAQVAARAERDGFVSQALTYTARDATLYDADMAPSGVRGLLRYHHTSLRWSSWTSPTPRDLASVRTGETVILSTSGRVHLTSDATYQRGGQPYACVLESPWLPFGDLPAHQAVNFLTVRGFGTFNGPHALTVSVSGDYIEIPLVTGVRPLATNDIIAASGRPYIWQLEIPGQLHYAIKIRISDNSEDNATFTLEGLDLQFGAVGRTEFGNIPADMKLESA